MLTTLIILPDGRIISSGEETTPAIFSCRLTQAVNDSQELTLGSTCASMLELQVLDPDSDLNLSQGQEIQALRVDEAGIQYPLGMFTLEKPIRSSTNMLQLTGYDRISWLDRDLTDWLAELDGWPYSLLTFAQMVCRACGLTLVNDSIPNGTYPVQAFVAHGITGRRLMQWAGQIAGRFCRATADGDVEFGWYEPSGIHITPDGDRHYQQFGLTYADYQVAPIEKVHLRLTQQDAGVVWPADMGEKNTYSITGNYLLTASEAASLLPVAKILYEQLSLVTYTPCKVTLPAQMDLCPGQTLQVTDSKGKTVTAWIMTRIQSGQLDTLECTGSPGRNSTTAVNEEDYRLHTGKLLEIRKEIEGLSVTAKKVETLKIGTRNLIRNSTAMLFDDYGFMTANQALCGRFVCGEAVCGE